jgi:hypothetical protein
VISRYQQPVYYTFHNETNHSATDKLKSAVDADPTAAHKQHHHHPSLELRATDAKFIFLLASTSEHQSPQGGDVGTAHIKSGTG